MEKLKNYSKKIVYYTSLIILGILSLLCIFYTTNILNFSEHTTITTMSIIMAIFILIFFLMYVLIINLTKHKIIQNNKKILIPIILLLYIIVNIYWVNSSNVIPKADANTVHELATYFIENNQEKLVKNAYLEKCPQQIGMSLFFAFIYKIFGSTNYQIIQYLNIVANILTILALYKILKKIDKENKMNDLIYFILILSFIPLILLTTYVYGDYIGLALMLWSVYLIMNYKETKKIKNIIISSVLLSLAYIVKTNYIISLIAIVIYLGLDILSNNKEIIKKILLIVVYILIVLLPYTTMKNIVINKLDLIKTESIPTSGYLYIGMSESDKGEGWYGEAVVPAWDDATKSREIYPKLIKTRLKEFVKNPLYCFNFYMRKTITGWQEPLFQSVWYVVIGKYQEDPWDIIKVSKKYKLLQYFMKTLLLIIYTSSLYYLSKNKKNLDDNTLLLIIIFIGGFLFHTLWEMKARYTLPYVVTIIPIAALGLNNFLERKQTIKVGNKYDKKNIKKI